MPRSKFHFLHEAAFLALVSIAAILLSSGANAQLATRFGSEFSAFLKADVPSLKGTLREKQQGAEVYNVKLKLSGFDATYAETAFGNDLRADFLQTGTMAMMDEIYTQLARNGLTLADSKLDPKVLGRGIFASDLKRKITVKGVEQAQWRATITLSNADRILIVFVKE